MQQINSVPAAKETPWIAYVAGKICSALYCEFSWRRDEAISVSREHFRQYQVGPPRRGEVASPHFEICWIGAPPSGSIILEVLLDETVVGGPNASSGVWAESANHPDSANRVSPSAWPDRCGPGRSHCRIDYAISADPRPDHVRLSDLETRFVCKACGRRGADVRPDFHWDKRPSRRWATVSARSGEPDGVAPRCLK
jgi:hypothetical protein